MKKQFATFLITITFLTFGVFVLTNQVYAETEISGNITSDTTWTLANSPYIVTGTIQVLEGAKLTIEPGVVTKFNKNKELVIGGELVAIGTQDQKILFTVNQISPISDTWLGIRFVDTNVDAISDANNNYISGSIIKYATIEYAYTINIISTNPFLSNNVISHNGIGGLAIYLEGSNSIIRDNLINNNPGLAISIAQSGAKILGNSIINNQSALRVISGSSEIFNNIIKDNNRGFDFIYGENSKIQYNILNNVEFNMVVVGVDDIKAEYNYWGTIDSSIIDSKIYDYHNDISKGKVIYEPYALAELKFDGSDTFGSVPVCASFVYSDWSVCQSNGTKTRTVISSSPSGCSGGNPVLTQSCTYIAPTCISWVYSGWSSCSSSGQQTRSIISSSPSGCAGGSPVLTQNCTYVPPVCTSWTYSGWSTCQSNGTQNRTVISSSPNGCSGGNPILTQSCTYVPPVCTSWTYSNWSSCQTNDTKNRTVISSSPSGCSSGNPVLTQSCAYIPPSCTSWIYSNWGVCANNQQTRTITSSQPANCAGGNPILSQSCNSTPLCTENNWTSALTPTSCPNNNQQTKQWTKIGQCQGGISRPSEEMVSCNYQIPTCTNFTYSDWGACSSSGVQSRTTLSASPSGCAGGNPVLSKSCNYIPPCTSDIWSCGDWSNCSTNGSRNRICTKTFDCPDAQTESPITNQHCEISNKPATQQITQNNSDESLNQNLITNGKDNLSVSTKNQNLQNEPTPIKNNGQAVNQEKNTTGTQVAEQRRSEVASAVQEILQVAEKDSGIGQQVKIIAQTQTQNQEKLEASLQKVQNRSGIARFFVGPNYGEINNAKKLLEQNREQIKQLGQIKNQLANQDDQQKLSEQVQLLKQSNQEIENSLNTSQKGFSLFGWLFRLFAK